jgi:hypothetical protein
MRLERKIDDALQDVWESQLPVATILARHRLRIVDMDEAPVPKLAIPGPAVLSATREAIEEEAPVLVRADWHEKPFLAWSADHVRSRLDEIEEML